MSNIRRVAMSKPRGLQAARVILRAKNARLLIDVAVML